VCGCAARETAATVQSLEARLSRDPGPRHRGRGEGMRRSVHDARKLTRHRLIRSDR